MLPETTPDNLSVILANAAERRGDHEAVVDLGATLTWTEADDRAGRMAAALVAAGIGKGDRVGVHFRKSADAYLAMHAVVRIGAIAVPLDPTASPAYLAQVCSLAGCDVVLTHDRCAASAHRLGDEAGLRLIIGIDKPDEGAGPAVAYTGADAFAGLDPVGPVATSADDPSYLITTSGSTGTPKSMCHTHGSALGHIDFMRGTIDFSADDRFADIAPNHFDISTPALWIASTLAATVVVVPEPHQMLPASAAQLVAEQRVSVWYSVPYLLVQLYNRGNIDAHDLSALRWVLFGGEVFPPGVLGRLMEKLPGARFANCYGPAEVNVVTVHHVDGPPRLDEPVPVGRPVSPTRIRLVDTDDDGVHHPVADGDQGEIWVNGPTMMRGYWQRPDLTEPTMVDDEEGRWYRTGDLGWYRPDGVLMFAGRRDHQVKVRGFRIELESIEATMEDVDGVDFAVAAVARDEAGDDVIVAGIRSTDGTPLNPDALRAEMSKYLPSYAIPAMFVTVNSGATTGSGKLDRRALRSAVADGHAAGGVHA